MVNPVKFSFCISLYTRSPTSGESIAAKRQNLRTKQKSEGAFDRDLAEFIKGFCHLN